MVWLSKVEARVSPEVRQQRPTFQVAPRLNASCQPPLAREGNSVYGYAIQISPRPNAWPRRLMRFRVNAWPESRTMAQLSWLFPKASQMAPLALRRPLRDYASPQTNLPQRSWLMPPVEQSSPVLTSGSLRQPSATGRSPYGLLKHLRYPSLHHSPPPGPQKLCLGAASTLMTARGRR